MKLTLEHLAPYLPYELKAIHYFDGEKLGREVTVNNVMAFVDNHTEAKILLRPLSDLTSRFEFHFIWENETDIKSIENLYAIDNESLLMNKFSYEFWSLCFENHIDVFGLIEQGLAIKMNDL